MIADLIEGNLRAHPDRARLLKGRPRRVVILASDVATEVGLVIGEGTVTVSAVRSPSAEISITTDSETLLDLPRTRLVGGLPSLADPIGRAVARKMLTGQLRIRGLRRIGLLTRVQKLLSVA